MEIIQDLLEKVVGISHSQPNQNSKFVALYLCSHGKCSQNNTHAEPIMVETKTKTQLRIIWVGLHKVVNDIKVVSIQKY